MAEECILINHAKVVHETIDDEVIIINLETGTYYSLTGTGTDVWRGAESGAAKQHVIDAMAQHYATDRTTVETAVNALIAELVREEIVLVEEGAGTTNTSLDLQGQVGATPFAAPSLSKHTNMADLLLLDPIHDVDEQGWPHQRPT